MKQVVALKCSKSSEFIEVAQKQRLTLNGKPPRDVEEWQERIKSGYLEPFGCMAPIVVEHCHFPIGGDFDCVFLVDLSSGTLGWTLENNMVGVTTIEATTVFSYINVVQ